MGRSEAVSLIATAIALFGGMALAAGQPDTGIIGFIDATVYEDTPPQPDYLLRRPDSSALSRDIAALLAAELARRHIGTDERARYILSFRFEDDPTVAVERPPDVEFRGGFGSAGNDDLDDLDMVLRLQLFDRGETDRSRARILILSLTDRANRLLWQGRATAAADTADDLAIVRAMAPPLIDRIGTAAYRERVPRNRESGD